MTQAALFPSLDTPFANGYAYEPDFLSVAEEAALIAQVEQLPFTYAQYKEFRARRRVVGYGGRFDYNANQLNAAAPIPEILHPLRDRAAAWAGRRPEHLTHALVAEYSEGTPLGWHRDVPDFDLVIGISLLSACRMRFRPYPPRPREKSIAIDLAPRSIYRMEGDARWGWQHSVPAVPALRYSITFRTLRGPRSPKTS
ncbi:MAG: alpha-ketoglutarate-dependent dioxygenase AlkB [Gammaproteobacteria bacterium]